MNIPLDRDTERRIRQWLWLSHGHTGQYGDDGEMQCSECGPFGVIDYKRTPLKDILDALDRLGLERFKRAVNVTFVPPFK